MRDLVAAMINESSTNVARMDAINNNATPEIKEQLKEGNLGITAAYEAAKLDEDEQKEIAEKAAAGENVRAKEIAEKVAEKTGRTIDADIIYMLEDYTEGALPMAYENGAVWCMSKKTFMEYVGMTDKNGQPIAKVNYGTSGKPERTLLGRTVVLCDYVASYSAALAKDTIFAFLFNFKDYVLNTNYSMGVKKYEDNDTDDQITKGIMLVDGKVVDKNSLVVVKKIEAV